MKTKVELEGRDFIEVEYEGENSLEGSFLSLSMVGCGDLTRLMQQMKQQFGKDPRVWTLPEGADHASLLVRELILKIKNQWQFPYAEAELCHCRNISTHLVDQAILAGAHRPEVVSRQTSASTACGTCRPQVQKIIDYRLGVGSIKKVS